MVGVAQVGDKAQVLGGGGGGGVQKCEDTIFLVDILTLSILTRPLYSNLVKSRAACIFHLILVGILSILILSVKNRGGCLMDKIC